MLIITILALAIALWAVIANTKLEKKNVLLESNLNAYANRLSHERKLKEQAEEALIKLQDTTSKLSERRSHNASYSTKSKLAKVKVWDMQETSSQKPKKQKSATVR